jgi:hypothetical protein
VKSICGEDEKYKKFMNMCLEGLRSWIKLMLLFF